ncbi:MAG TPA: hypothetical protein VIF62_13860 [Labilithrix sp.]|jgi:hypothetical protein
MRLTFLSVAVVTGAMLLAVACARRDDHAASTTTTSAAETARSSCDTLASLGTCSEYAHQGRASLGLERSMCDGFKGRFSQVACPESGRIARCELPSGEVKRYYAQLAIADAKADCESELVHGRFVSEH